MRVRDQEEAQALALFRSLDAKSQALLLPVARSLRQQRCATGPAPSLPLSDEQAPPIGRLFG